MDEIDPAIIDPKWTHMFLDDEFVWTECIGMARGVTTSQIKIISEDKTKLVSYIISQHVLKTVQECELKLCFFLKDQTGRLARKLF